MEIDEQAEELEAMLANGNERVLLVDDNPEMRQIARRHLVSRGYRVMEAEHGPAALEMLQSGSFDLLFTDIMMPEGMNGYQLAAAARHMQPAQKVLFTTGYVGAGAGHEAEEPPTGMLLRKPYRKLGLASAVRCVLEP